jgi:hypothetical protein
MKLEYVPLLSVQRDLYRLPRGFERFREYLRTIIDSGTKELQLPLSGMNPMGKDHVPELLDRLLSIDAEGAASLAMARAERSLESLPGSFRVCLVLSDDWKGGWTNRWTSELTHRLGERALRKRGWIAGTLWTSERPSPEEVAAEVLATIFRTVYVLEHGEASTLGEILAQEGRAMKAAGLTEPNLEDDDLAYTREVLQPLGDRSDSATLIAALFGDAAARELGHEPLGLSPRAGLALALHDARLIA